MLRLLPPLCAFLFLAASPVSSAIQLDNAFPNLSFVRPVDIQSARDGTNRLFVVEKPGVISVMPNHPGATFKTTFLDIQDRVDEGGSEEGLLGLAFHPEYPDSPYFYVNYTAASPDRTVISRFKVSDSDPDSADAGSEFSVLEVGQPYSNHNGGQLAFGPDGLLYIGLGDGGSSGDPLENAQNLQVLLGKMLRIDVDTRSGSLHYGIPFDNPYVGNPSGYREEIYALGFRNPWRYSFDVATGRLWVGDVGQGSWEEIDIVEKGGNYGWDNMEGKHCYEPATGCDTAGMVLPIHEYDHSLGRRAITGGFVYRGTLNHTLNGRYIYADYSSGTLYSLEYDGTGPAVETQLLDTTKFISTFGIDEGYELYLASYGEGRIFRVGPLVTGIRDLPGTVRLGAIVRSIPNPFNPETRILFTLREAGLAEIAVFDVTGRRVRLLLRRPFEPGPHEIIWDGRDDHGVETPSGVYFCRLMVDGRAVDAGRLVLLR
ncbi:MAG: protein up-regulated by thyroid hormone-putative PQQ-dependent glucose dehydrogenase [Candidatus Krumholzibacteriota bacterium]|nr:protein up-regulated by thyroid hormone-putative PQQ-dependent glucose dehydrogenase [Candidatus Krumholzibacteriota bacterium]